MTHTIISKPTDVLKLCKKLRHQETKYCKIFYLDKDKKLINIQTHSLQNKKTLKIKDIFVPGFYISAANIIIVHNHINELLLPNNLEIKLTKESFTAGCFLGIDLIDHLIVTKSRYYSFHESKII